MTVLVPTRTVHGQIEDQSRQDPAGLCVSLWQSGRWQDYSRREFWSRVEHWGSRFQQSLPAHTLILFVKKLDLDLLASYIGAMKAGHLPALISPPSAKSSASEYQRKIGHILELTGAGAVVADPGLFKTHEPIHVFTPEGDHPGISRPYAKPSDSALVQFSSGSTGLQKGVVLTHSAIAAHMLHYASALKLTSDDRVATWLPLYHDMGLIACYLMPLMCGVPFYQIDPFDWLVQPDLLLQTIEAKKATICFLPNFAYHVLASKGKTHDLSSMRLFVNCSEPARQSTHERFVSKHPSTPAGSLSVCYALAENTFAVSQTSPGEGAREILFKGRRVLSCGSILPGSEVRIFDQDSEGEGEIGIRGSSLFQQFVGGALPLREGFYLTGDLGCLDQNGELFITGRKKDLIIVNGKNLYPQDLEHVSSQVSGVYPGRVVCFGSSSLETGSEELMVLVETDETRPSAQLRLDVQRAIQSEAGVLPKRVEVVKHMTLVKTSSGKISRTRNRELYLNGEFALL